METIKACHKEYIIKEQLDDQNFICERKGQLFFIRKYEKYLEEGQLLAFQIKKVTNMGIKTPKLYGIDKRNGYIVSEYIDGETLMDILSREDIDEKYIEQLFENSYRAKINKVALNYEPDKWKVRDGVVYYTYPYFIKYTKEDDFTVKGLPLYFNTHELANFMHNKGVFYDKNRIKNTYDTNKQIVLITCKYYK